MHACVCVYICLCESNCVCVGVCVYAMCVCQKEMLVSRACVCPWSVGFAVTPLPTITPLCWGTLLELQPGAVEQNGNELKRSSRHHRVNA